MYHTHRPLYTPLDDELVGKLGSGHELTASLCRDVEIDGEQLLLVLLRPERLVMRLNGLYVVQIEPILEAHLNEVLRLGVYLLVGERDEEGVLDVLHLKRQPPPVPGEVGQELLFVAGRAERREPYPPS